MTQDEIRKKILKYGGYEKDEKFYYGNQSVAVSRCYQAHIQEDIDRWIKSNFHISCPGRWWARGMRVIDVYRIDKTSAYGFDGEKICDLSDGYGLIRRFTNTELNDWLCGVAKPLRPPFLSLQGDVDER